MDLLAALRTFVRITETGSFSAVARENGASQPAISRQVAQLEEYLGVRLLQRSTRSLTLTEDGRGLLSHAQVVLDTVAEAEAFVGRRRASPAGLVRLGCPSVFGRVQIAPRIGTLMERYPELTIELMVEDDVVDMVQHGLDLSVRVGEIADPSLVARRIGMTSAQTVASTAYLERMGEPRHPRDLMAHECVLFSRAQVPTEWLFQGDEGEITVPVKGRFRSNSIEAVLAAVLAGLGISRVPGWMVQNEMERGKVRLVLREWHPKPRPIYIVYPSRRFLAPRTRAVIDFLVEEFRNDPVTVGVGVPS